MADLLALVISLAQIGGSGKVLTAAAPRVDALTLVYPPEQHQTPAAQIFLIGTAPIAQTVTVNGQPIPRSVAGHFGPSFPLTVGENRFVVQAGDRTIIRKVTRLETKTAAPTTLMFAANSLQPAEAIGRQPGEWVCFQAIAPVGAKVSVTVADRDLPLVSQPETVTLPPNFAALTSRNQPQVSPSPGLVNGCTRLQQPGRYQPTFRMVWQGKTLTQAAPGEVEILAPEAIALAEVQVPQGVARTGPSADHSRLTPLPQGTIAQITGYEGNWLRLDYGGWIHRREVLVKPGAQPPLSVIRSSSAGQSSGKNPASSSRWTEVRFPLQVPVPVSVNQGDRTFTLTLHNTIAQTDTIAVDDDPLIDRVDWQQISPERVQYTFHLKPDRQWGYRLRYEDTTLVLALRHPPRLGNNPELPLQGISILLDPGHGGEDDLGAQGPTGHPEKAVTLELAQLLRQQLVQRGATVYLTREEDKVVELADRVQQIEDLEPTIALSLHYNALPDDGDALNTQGIGSFWFHPQSHGFTVFLHNYLVAARDRPSYGVFWNNLALTRPTVAPTALLELGFMIHPEEYEWIVNPDEQIALATAIAEGLTRWLR